MTPVLLFLLPVYSAFKMPIDKCKLPAYVSSDPLTWFKAVEACFRIHNIRRDQDRSALLIAALPAKQLQQVSAILASTTSDQYESLKRRLISTDAPSFQENWEKCMALPPFILVTSPVICTVR